MQTRSASRYLHLARKCIDMAEQANHPNNHETLVRFAAIWLSLAAEELTEASCQHSDGPLPPVTKSARYFVSSTKTPFQSAGGGFSSNMLMRSE
jgi:hypothetical protein